jgi:hypothetical protein
LKKGFEVNGRQENAPGAKKAFLGARKAGRAGLNVFNFWGRGGKI